MANRAPLRPVALALLIFSVHLVLPDAAPIIPQTTSRQSGEQGEYFEGDIRLKLGEDPYTFRNRYARRQERMVMGPETDETDGESEELISHNIWPNRTVYYKFDSDLDPSYRERFDIAMQEWMSLTCIEFKRPTPENPNYLLYSDKFDCSSYVGMQGGRQDISINNNCRKVGHAMHEIGHALGLWHEHSRPDRDLYVEVKWDNIRSSEKKERNFGRLTMEEFEPINNLNVMYDFESIMHYDEYAFSTNPGTRPTIQIKDSIKLPRCMDGFQLGQRSRISWRDQLRINRLYQCTEKVNLLLEMKPECDPLVPDPTTSSSTLTPTPTAVPVQTSLPTPTPTPTPTPAAVPEPCTPPTIEPLTPGDRVQHENSIHLMPYGNPDLPCNAGLFCENEHIGCYIKSCDSDFGCYQQGFMYSIEKEKKKNKNVRVGDKVALQSHSRRAKWFNCSDGECTISECTSNQVDIANTSQCDQLPYFKLYVEGKEERDGIRANDIVIVKHHSDDTYLQCGVRSCRMLPYGVCPELESSASGSGSAHSTGRCLPQQFIVRTDL